jgi:hypothetical protein
MINSHILMTEYNQNGGERMEYVMVYEPADMEEVFTVAERAKLTKGEALTRTDKYGSCRYIDMVAAAKRLMAQKEIA